MEQSAPHFRPRHLCIHGHFYQPPRENPWLDAVEVQDSARPYHDWNDRVAMECYGPNAGARISTWDGWILDIRNTYKRISFNFGPTLLSWMEENRPAVYDSIVEADRESARERSGHGNAIAQSYNHTILPLATPREKRIQIEWGLEDFRERFGRDPEGMWLPECAVDTATLEALAAAGIAFTVLAPRQAQKFRDVGQQEWHSADGSRIDPTRPYTMILPSGKSIVLFFYDGPISQAIAFEGLLNDGHAFANRLMQGFNDERDWPQLLSIATDGESYGHHHFRGEMALAYTLHLVAAEGHAKLTNYGEFLAQNPPTAEAVIHDNSSWSCVHGIERWRSDCGCNSGTRHGWHQRWREPLRAAFRYLANRTEAVYDERAPKYLHDPEGAVLRYVSTLLDTSAEHLDAYLEKESLGNDAHKRTDTLRLLEMRRLAQFLFTSCAWFFDEVSGIETVQNLKYAGRLVQILRPYVPNVEEVFLELLSAAPSNLADIENGAECYHRHVAPGIVDLQRVVAHHAISHFDQETNGVFYKLYCYEVAERDGHVSTVGNTSLKLSRVSVRSLKDGETLDTTVVVLHFGGHDFRCSISAPATFAAYESMREELFSTYHRGSLTELVRVVDENFGWNFHSIEHLFSEGKRELLRRITGDSFRRFDNAITMIYEDNRKFMDYLLQAGAPLPRSFLSSAEFVLNQRVLTEIEVFKKTSQLTHLHRTACEAKRLGVRLDQPEVMHALKEAFRSVFAALAAEPSSHRCNLALAMLEVYDMLEPNPEYWEAQNVVFSLLRGRRLAGVSIATESGGAFPPATTMPGLLKLAEKLRVSPDPFGTGTPRAADTRASSDRMAMKLPS